MICKLDQRGHHFTTTVLHKIRASFAVAQRLNSAVIANLQTYTKRTNSVLSWFTNISVYATYTHTTFNKHLMGLAIVLQQVKGKNQYTCKPIDLRLLNNILDDNNVFINIQRKKNHVNFQMCNEREGKGKKRRMHKVNIFLRQTTI